MEILTLYKLQSHIFSAYPAWFFSEKLYAQWPVDSVLQLSLSMKE